MILITIKQMSKIYFFFYCLCHIKEVICSYEDNLFIFFSGNHHHQAHFGSYENHDTIRKYWRNKWFLINK